MSTSLRVAALMLAVGALVMLPEAAWASVGSGGGLPYESWLESIRNSVTGPVAFTFAIVGMVAAGITLIFGGDMNGFLRTLMLIIFVMCFLVGAQNMMTFFGKGAEVAQLLAGARAYA